MPDPKQILLIYFFIIYFFFFSFPPSELGEEWYPPLLFFDPLCQESFADEYVDSCNLMAKKFLLNEAFFFIVVCFVFESLLPYFWMIAGPFACSRKLFMSSF